MIDYLSRSAPTRLTPWPGNKEESLEIFEEILPPIVKRNKKTIVMKETTLHFTDYEKTFMSITDAAKYLGLNKSSFGNVLSCGKIPFMKDLEAVTYDDTYLTQVATGNRKPIYIVDHGVRYEYDSMRSAMENYDVCESMGRRWLKRGSCMVRGITEVGVIE